MRDPDLDRIIHDLRARREQLTRMIQEAASTLLGDRGEPGEAREAGESTEESGRD